MSIGIYNYIYKNITSFIFIYFDIFLYTYIYRY